jgi:hypothetical protein
MTVPPATELEGDGETIAIPEAAGVGDVDPSLLQDIDFDDGVSWLIAWVYS